MININVGQIFSKIGTAFGPAAGFLLSMVGAVLFYFLFVEHLFAPLQIEIYEKRKNGYKRTRSVGKIIKKKSVPLLKVYNLKGPVNLFMQKPLLLPPIDGKYLIQLSNSKDKLILIKDGALYRPVEPDFDNLQLTKGYSGFDIEFWAQQERRNTAVNYATPLKGLEKYSGPITFVFIIGIVLLFFILGMREMGTAIDKASSANARAAEVTNTLMNTADRVVARLEKLNIETCVGGGG